MNELEQIRKSVRTEIWLEDYATDHCTLCGNHGWIDTRNLRSPAGYLVGRLNYCLCPNGQALRLQDADLEIIAGYRVTV